MTSYNIPERNASAIENVGPHDVLLGRGGATNNHSGNQMFRLLVAEHQQEYLRAKKHDKVIIARRVVSIIQNNGGRFLQSGDSKDHWVQVADKKAQEKTSQALREGLDVRNQKLRPSKQIKALRRNSESSASQLTVEATLPSSTVTNAAITSSKVVTPKSSTQKSAFTVPSKMMNREFLMPSLKDEPSEPILSLYQRSPLIKQELNRPFPV